MSKKDPKFVRQVIKALPINRHPFNWEVTLACGHQCALQLGNYPPPKEMKCFPCTKEMKAGGEAHRE